MGETTQAIKHDIDDERHKLENNLEGIEQKLKQTTEQVTNKVDDVSEQVHEKVEQVQQKVRNATDWRHQFEERPLLGVGLAFGGGVLLASMLGSSDNKRDRNRQSYSYGYPAQYQGSQQTYTNGGHGATDVGRQHVSSTFDNIKGALMGVAAAQAKTYLEKSVPGFGNEYSQVEKETNSDHSQKSGGSQAGSYPVQGSSHDAGRNVTS